MGNRTRKSTINISVSLFYQIVILVLSFVARWAFINTLGVSYLGINSLFENILKVLSLADLGMNSAMMFSLYKPLADNDENAIIRLLTYFGKIYRRIALVVTIIGIIILPFLKLIVNLKTPIDHIYFYYILNVANTVVSYLCISKTVIISADQNDYINRIVSLIFDVLKNVIQIYLLFKFKNYTAYLVVGISMVILGNITKVIVARHKYPFVKQNDKGLISEEKKTIWINVKSMFAYHIGGVILNNTDNILISIIVSTEMVGIYTNYLTPVAAIMALSSSIFIAMQASVGNLATEKNPLKLFDVFKKINAISYWVYGVCTICLCVLLQDFITVWLGKEFLVSDVTVGIIAFSYYITGVLYPIWCYRETVGLFRDTKYVMFVASALNIVLSVILGHFWGLPGILVATIIARILSNVWYEPKVLFKKYFKQKVYPYFFNQIKRITYLSIIMIGIFYLKRIIYTPHGFIGLIIESAIVFMIANVLILLVFIQEHQLGFFFGLMKKAVNKCIKNNQE